jgi:hypothetical protein
MHHLPFSKREAEEKVGHVNSLFSFLEKEKDTFFVSYARRAGRAGNEFDLRFWFSKKFILHSLTLIDARTLFGISGYFPKLILPLPN